MVLQHKFHSTLALLGLLAFGASCGNQLHQLLDDSGTKLTNSSSGSCASGGVYFRGQALSVITKNCAACHGPGSPQGDWTDYATAYAKRDRIIQRAVVEKTMPKAPNDAKMTDKDREVLREWAKSGAKEACEASAEPGGPLGDLGTLTTEPANSGGLGASISSDSIVLPSQDQQQNSVACDSTMDSDILAATKAKDTVSVEQLLAKKACAKAIDTRGYSTLFIAIESGDLATTNLLLKNGADTNLRLASGEITALTLASQLTDPELKSQFADALSAGIENDKVIAYTFTNSVKSIYQKRCDACHLYNPQLPNWQNYDVSVKLRDKLLDRVIIKKDMPLSNATQMTDEERTIFKKWLFSGQIN